MRGTKTLQAEDKTCDRDRALDSLVDSFIATPLLRGLRNS